jgi:hypothetical protein
MTVYLMDAFFQHYTLIFDEDLLYHRGIVPRQHFHVPVNLPGHFLRFCTIIAMLSTLCVSCSTSTSC